MKVDVETCPIYLFYRYHNIKMLKEQQPKITTSKFQKPMNSPSRIHSKKDQNNNEKRIQNSILKTNTYKQRLPQKKQIFLEVLTTSILFGNVQYSAQDLDGYLRQLHQSLTYSSFVLGSPNDHVLKQKIITLPESQDDKKRKILLLDLQQTLVNEVHQNQPFQVQLDGPLDKIRLNIRPFCFEFLQSMSEHFLIYIFTSYNQSYAQPIVEYLNSDKKYIRGSLTRNNCFQTRSGIIIKDLRIIKNRDLSQIVIVDSVAHCFGLQIQNGIPIIPFKNRKNDRELLGLQKLLLQLKDASDVRSFLSGKLKLKQCCEMKEDEFVKLIKLKNMNTKKKTTLY